MTTNIDRILVATDGSEAAGRALDFAATLASATGAALDVVTVLDLGQLDVYDGFYMNEEQLLDWQRKLKRQVLDGAKEQLEGDGVKATYVILRGPVVKTLTKYAEDARISMMVVGRQGKGAIDRLFQGSVSKALSSRSPVPITIVA